MQDVLRGLNIGLFLLEKLKLKRIVWVCRDTTKNFPKEGNYAKTREGNSHHLPNGKAIFTGI